MTGKLRLTETDHKAVAMVVEIARQGAKKPVQLARVASTLGVSVSHLETLAPSMRRDGLLRSFRGPSGGYQLAKPAAEISIVDIALSAQDLPGARTKEEVDTLTSSGIPQAQDLWDQLEICQYLLLQHITLADVLHGGLDAHPLLKGIRDRCTQAEKKRASGN